MSPLRKVKPHGQIRQSQVVTLFGPGAMLDLPNHAVIIGGLETWNGAERPEREIREERLIAKLERILAIDGLRLYLPPLPPQQPGDPQTGITCWQFPEWFIAQTEELRDGFRSRPLVHREALVRGKYQSGRKSFAVVPVRFVQACIRGHISDIDWYGFVHEFSKDCRRELFIEERGTSGYLGDIYVRCACGARRSMAVATKPPALLYCKGQRPWLGPGAWEQCRGDSDKLQVNRLLIRSASNAYFPELVSVISIPELDDAIRKAVDAVWENHLQYVESLEDLRRERRRANVHAALEGLDEARILSEVERRRSGARTAGKPIRQAELETLLEAPEGPSDDVPEADFYARSRALKPGEPFADKIDRIVMVHRLREVVAQIGFTRFQASSPDIDGEIELDVRRAPLARDVRWLPAVENRGEGLFLSFRSAALSEWAERAGVKTREAQLNRGYSAWASRRRVAASFPGVIYVMLHTLSHLLVTAVSLECGYSSSALRERIYVGSAGSGILLFTGTSDSDGTLGGLVGLGKNLERHIEKALEIGRLCSNDPVCAQHEPDNTREERFLAGAACHGCILIPETCCERRNDFLDRALVVPTVAALGAEFFRETRG